MAALVGLNDCLLRPELDEHVRPGERRHAVCVATSLRQARLFVAAALAIVQASPLLRSMVERVDEDEITSRNGTALSAFPCSARSVRGWPISTLLFDEAAHFVSETDGPAVAERVFASLVPSTAQFEDAARIIVASTPYGTSGMFVVSGDFDVLGPAEVAALARAAESEQDAALFTVAAFTGLRLGELRALRWRDVDFAGRIVHVRQAFVAGEFTSPKGKRVRSVPLIDQAAVALDGLSRRERYVGADDLVFPSSVGGPVQDSRLRRRFKDALSRAGLPRMRFHDLRHSFGTLAVQAFPLSDVQAFMGHADVATTMIYVHHVPKLDAAERLSALVRAETTPEMQAVGA